MQHDPEVCECADCDHDRKLPEYTKEEAVLRDLNNTDRSIDDLKKVLIGAQTILNDISIKALYSDRRALCRLAREGLNLIKEGLKEVKVANE